MKSDIARAPDESEADASDARGLAQQVDLNKLRVFSVIAEAGGVSAAARRLALTRSAVSHSLAALEDSLGLPLFHRVGKKLVLTRQGERLQRAALEARDGIGRALVEIGEHDEVVRGTVRLGLYLGFSRFRLAGVVAGFLSEHARARVRTVYGSRAELGQALLQGRIDFALSLQPGPGEHSARLASERLFEQSLVLVARERPRRAADPFEPIARLPIVDYFRAEPLIDRWTAHHFGRRRRVPRRNLRVFTSANVDLALELCVRGAGACVLPRDVALPYRRRGELVLVRGPRAALRDAVWLNELAGARRTRLQEAFREALFSGLG